MKLYLLINQRIIIRNPTHMKSIPSKINQKNQSFQEQRIHYQQIITRLIKQNQLLRQQLQALSHFKLHTQDFQFLQNKRDQDMSSDLNRSQKSTEKTSRPTTVISKPPIKYTTQELRWPQGALNSKELHMCEYEQKIYELTNFLTNMKKKTYFQTQKHQDEKSFVKLVQAMEDIIIMFEKDRNAFINKIQQLLLLIDCYQKTQREYSQRERRFQLDLNIANEQLVIFKRLKKTK